MKKSALKIRSFFLILALCFVSIIGHSQDQKLSKKDNKETRKAERLKGYETLDTLLESRKFAFVTDRIQGTTGAKVYNVIQIDEARVFVRCDNPKNTSGRYSGEADNTTPLIGPTGLFFEGDIDNWEISRNSKNLSYSVKFDVNTTGSNTGIFYEIYININPNKTAGVEIKSRNGNYVYTNYLGNIKTL